MTLYEVAARVKYAAIGVKKTRDVTRLARPQRKKLSTFFLLQKQFVLDVLNEKQYLFSESFRRLAEVQYTLNDFNSAWDDIADKTEFELQTIITQTEAAALTKGAAMAETMFVPGKGGSFDLQNPRAVNWFLERGGSFDYIKGINRTTGNQLKTVIASALDEGWTYNKTAKAINQRFSAFSVQRAQNIAVYETGSAYEAGNRMFIDSVADTGIVMEKSWQNSGDELVSDGCLQNSADGWIPLNQAHSSGHQQPPRMLRCRCYEIYRESER